MIAIELCERALIPDWLTRLGMRRLLARRIERETGRAQAARKAFLDSLETGPIAVSTDDANAQHYEVPERFFQTVLGKHLKYSCGYWDETTQTLDESEAAMLALTCERAALRDGLRILELGCGWGSITLWMAKHYPNATIVAVSNSSSQKKYIDEQAHARGLHNINVITADINDFQTTEEFDRVVSVEMFEHMRNYKELMRRIASWLAPGGQLFVHIFCHREFAYPFEEAGKYEWISRNFFTGGTMPAENTLLSFQTDLKLQEQWRISGQHYEKTANAWLEKADQHREAVLALFNNVYGEAQAHRWLQRWRMFFLACAELFGYDEGNQWLVGHYRFGKTGNPD